jgi:hypothetical protein
LIYSLVLKQDGIHLEPGQNKLAPLLVTEKLRTYRYGIYVDKSVNEIDVILNSNEKEIFNKALKLSY